MRCVCTTTIVAAVLLSVGCSAGPALHRATLQCKSTEGKCFSFYSFNEGVLPTPPVDARRVDILYYFDGDDCSQGALIGHDDRPGYLFPVGHKSWGELAMLSPPAEDSESVVAVKPLSEDKEGLALWVRTSGGEYVPVRIRSIHAVSYADLIAGETATLELEWSRPQAGEQE
jgi:hypothetical protein